MRLAACFECNTLSKLPDPAVPNEPEADAVLIDWIDRHRHGYRDLDMDPREPGAHPGGQVFGMEENTIPFLGHERGGSLVGGKELEDIFLGNVVEKLGEVTGNNHWDIRDELKDDATRCFVRHGNPEWPGKPCGDYHDRIKLVGRRNLPEAHRRYLCDFCPYEESVRVQKRWNAGQYRR